MGVIEKIKEIEAEMARTQKNKATEYHLGLLKGRLARLRMQLLEPSGKGGAKGDGFEVLMRADARVALIGYARASSNDAKGRRSLTPGVVRACVCARVCDRSSSFPSVGKSTILSTLTDTKSEAASYEFTTLTCIPGVLEVRVCGASRRAGDTECSLAHSLV